jgi:hypothetical protein
LRQAAVSHGTNLIIGGATKGQRYWERTELQWIFETNDRELIAALEGNPEFSEVLELFRNLKLHFFRKFKDIRLISPFHYLEWKEDDILRVIGDELGFQQVTDSWPVSSTNCAFNYVSQKLAVKSFGYSQHETEVSQLVRKGEMTRSRALKIVNTPIPDETLESVVSSLGLSKDELFE